MKVMKYQKLTWVLLLFFCTGAATAEQLLPSDSIVEAEKLKKLIRDSMKSQLWNKLDTGPDGNLLGNDSAIALQVYDDNQTVNLNFALGTSVQPATTADDNHRVWSYNVKLQAPANSDEGSSPLPTLDGLHNATTVSFAIQYSLVPPNLEAFKNLSAKQNDWQAYRSTIGLIIRGEAEADKACHAEIQDKVLEGFESAISIVFTDNIQQKTDWRTLDELNNDKDLWDALVETSVIDPKTLSPNQSTALAQIRRFVANPSEGVSPDTYMIKVCAPELYESVIAKRAKATWTSDKWSTSFGAEGEYGQEKFDYLNPTSFEKAEETNDVYSLSAYAAWLKNGPGVSQSYTLSYTYQRAYKAADETTVCINMAANPEEDCREARFAPPKKTNKSLLGLEGRARFEQAPWGHPIAFQVKGTYDFEDEEWGIEVPIYLFSFSGDQLNAGIRVGWQSETEEAEVGFFYGQKF